MKGKQLIILVAVAGVLIGIAVSQKKKDYRKVEPDAEPAKLFTDLDINAVTQIEFASNEGTTILSVNKQDVWTAESKFGYPAEFEKIKTFLIKLSDLKQGQDAALSEDQLAEVKLLSPDNATPANSADTGTRLVLKDKTGKALAKLIVGKEFKKAQASQNPQMPGGYAPGAGQYIKTSSGNTYIIPSTLDDVDRSAGDWINKDLLNVSGTAVTEMKVTGPDRQDIHITKMDSHILSDIPADHEGDEAAISSLTGALNYLRFEDIADPAGNNESYGFDQPVKIVAVNDQNQEFTLLVGNVVEGKTDRYLRASVKLLSAKNEGDEKPDETAIKKLADETKSLNDKLAGWTYIIASYKSDSLLKKHEELIKKVKKEVEPNEDSKDSNTEAAPAPENK